MGKKIVFIIVLSVICGITMAAKAAAFEEIVTVPAENPQGVTLNLERGEYIVEISGGAVALVYPINPNYCWRIGVAVGIDAQGGQDEPDIGTIYYDPDPAVFSQVQAENAALKAVSKGVPGTSLRFSLRQRAQVRFWVSDFDYSDNSGMVKLSVKKY